MPFETLESLPENIKKLSRQKQERWRGAWNGRFRQCTADGDSEKDCEGSAFAVANAAIKELDGEPETDAQGNKLYGGDLGSAVYDKQISQTEAAYDAVGGSTDKACGNCRWFVSPNGCILVQNYPEPINPNGISNRWEAVTVFEPDSIEVIIFGQGTAELNEAAVERAGGAVGRAGAAAERGEKAETKREGGVDYPASDFAVVPDADNPSTWKLRLAEDRAGNVTVAQVARAITALQPSGFRGNRVSLTSEQKTQAVSRIGRAIGRTGGTDDMKANLRERLDAVKSRTLEVDIPQPSPDVALGYKATRLGTFIRERKEDLDISTESLADSMGITASTLSQIERGEIARPPDERLRGAARRLNSSLSALLAMIPEEDKQIYEASKQRTFVERLLQKVKDAISAFLQQDQPTGAFKLYKDTSGNLRWFAWASNRWRDHDNPPEIITEKAHKDYVAYLDRTGNYPEAWLWHTPGTKWGQADWADYADGFLVVSGTVDAGREHVADALAAQKDLGVSHGFTYRHDDSEQGIIGYYRSFEISPLPVDAAANPWTSLEVLNKEADMGFSDKKRTWLVGQLGETEVARLENDTDAMKAALEAKGVEYKDAPADEGGDDDKNKVAATLPIEDTEANKALIATVAEAAVKALTGSDTFKAIAEGQTQLTATVKGLSDRLDALERTDDEKIAAQVGARSHRPNGHVASRSEKNVVGEEEAVPGGPSVLDEIMEGLEISAPPA